MDFESIKSRVQNLTLYDLKAGVRQVQNAVMNLTEMEAKVREATNADPWGASATLMQEIAAGTHNYQQLNEIMPMIYKRFTDKTAEEWRQIYKALQLLEFLVKNGSERVVDDARSHLSLIRMLRQFHYIDPNGKDQGVNVRNRSGELVKLLGDVDMIRAERKKARANRNKYGGVEGGAGLGGGLSSGSGRYGGFGSESAGFGTYQGEVYGDGGGFGGRETDFSSTQRRGEQFEEYDEEEEGATRPSRAKVTAASAPVKKEPVKQKEPEQDLFDFSEEPTTSAPRVVDQFGAAPAAATAGDDDDFDDFHDVDHYCGNAFGCPKTSAFCPSSQYQQLNLTDGQCAIDYAYIFSIGHTAFSASQRATPAGREPIQTDGTELLYIGQRLYQLNFFKLLCFCISIIASLWPGSGVLQFVYIGSNPRETDCKTAGVQKKEPSKGPDLASMAKAKSEAGLWGVTASSTSPSRAPTGPSTAAPNNRPSQALNGLDDLLG
ncbi:hypothetical protein DV735_g2554, partial [Chaetothyriales sp. CBS 134920]